MKKHEHFLEKFGEQIEIQLNEYHQFLRTPPKGEHFEDLVSQTLIRLGDAHDWFDGDHAAGTDIWGSRLGNLSLKTNKLYGKNVIRTDISSHRLTSFGNDLDEMLNYIESKDTDYYLLCTRRTNRGAEYEKLRDQGKGYEQYEIFLIPSDFIRVTDYEWKTANGGWKANIEPGFHLTISKSMSNQFWIKGVPYENIKEHSIKKICIDHADIPYKLHEFGVS